MNHQIYIDWIFEDGQDLTTQQAVDLDEHLQGCERCQSLADSFHNLEAALDQAEVVGPQSGFVTRWENHLEASRERLHRRQIITTFLFVVAGLAILLGVLIFAAWPWLRTPSLLFWTWIYQLFTIYTYLDAAREFASPLLAGSRGAITMLAWVFGLGLLSELAVLWVVSFRLLTNPRRMIV
jgi:predicted anti-sigma-YlaC factor YlaD